MNDTLAGGKAALGIAQLSRDDSDLDPDYRGEEATCFLAHVLRSADTSAHDGASVLYVRATRTSLLRDARTEGSGQLAPGRALQNQPTACHAYRVP